MPCWAITMMGKAHDLSCCRNEDDKHIEQSNEGRSREGSIYIYILEIGFYSRIMRPAEWEMTTTKRIVYYSQIPKGGDMPCHVGPHGAVPGGRGQKTECNSLYFGEMEWARLGKPI